MSSSQVKKWHDEVPGARWFRADLHIHTLDDALGNATWKAPAEVKEPLNPRAMETREAYVRAFLQAAIKAGIEVVALTPHSAHVPGDATTSVVWDIVTAWQSAADDDGIPFRDKLYAVFPGFEPSVADGGGGIHLIFLFDPEIGKDRYLKAFTVITGGQNVWHNGSHQTCTKDAAQAFEALRELKRREGDGWDWLCFAPHAFSDKGLIYSLKSSMGKYFPHEAVAALELKDNDLPEDAVRRHPDYLQGHLERYSQPLVHSSDAYCLSNAAPGDICTVDSPKKRGIGYRYTFIKLASPRIESLRQAFLSRDSRVRVAYAKDGKGALVLSAVSPKPFDATRPWLRSVTIKDGTAFFGGKGRQQKLCFSPDLTCVIGGRMTGKSTLLDGLRTYCSLQLPTDTSLAEDVAARAGIFLSGTPTIDIDICGPAASTLSNCERWPAKFFTQRELQRIAKDRSNVRRILFHLAPEGAESLLKQAEDLGKLDARLKQLAGDIATARENEEEKEQALKTAQDAKTAMEQFRDAGADLLTAAQADQGRQRTFQTVVEKLRLSASQTAKQAEALELPKIDSLGGDTKARLESLRTKIAKIGPAIEQVTLLLNEIGTDATALADAIEAECRRIRTDVQKSLVEKGRKADDLNQFDALSELAANYEAARQQYEQAHLALTDAESQFSSTETERSTLLETHRQALERIMKSVNTSITSIRVSLARAAVQSPLDMWIRGLKETGLTRWWNDHPNVADPHLLYQKLVDDRLGELGMSSTVATRFKEVMTLDRRYLLRSLRAEDDCRIEATVGNDGAFRPIARLSGGKQISVVLSLLLESSDTSPLVIDQPEDELDKAFLADTLLPILRRLKGRRQIIFATHDANIVVNGDADQVILLEATAEQGEVRAQGTIDHPDIRDAILRILDGGQEAFDMRKKKYGY